MVKKWVESWINDIERPEQFKHSLQLFKANIFINSTLPLPIRNQIRTILDSLENTTYRWAKCYKYSFELVRLQNQQIPQ